MRLDQRGDRLRAEERHVAAQHEHGRCRVEGWGSVALQRRERRGHGPSGSVGALLHRQLDPLGKHLLERTCGGVDDHDPPGAGPLRGANGPQQHRQPTQLMQNLRRARAHARALARGEDEDGGRAHEEDASRTRPA